MEVNKVLQPGSTSGNNKQDPDLITKPTQSHLQDPNATSKSNEADNGHHSLSANESVTSNLQDPYMEFSSEQKKPSLFASGSGILRSDLTKKMVGLTPNPTKFSSSPQKSENLEIDLASHGAIEDPHVISNVSFPMSLLSRDNSVFDYRQKPTIGEQAPRNHIPLNESNSIQLKTIPLSQSVSINSETGTETAKKKKEGFLTRALNTINKSIHSKKSILKNKDSTVSTNVPKARARFVTYLSPELKKDNSEVTQPLDSGTVTINHVKPEEEGGEEVAADDKETLKEQDEEKNGSEIPIEKASEDGFVVPQQFASHEKTGLGMLLSKPSKEILKQNSGHSQSDVNISPSLLLPNAKTIQAKKRFSSMRSSSDRRRVSLGHNLQLVQAEAVKMAMKFPKLKRFLKKTLSLFLLIVISFILLSVFSVLITFPYTEANIRIWVGQFFHGFLIAGIPFLFLKETIKAALEEFAKKEKSPTAINMRYGWIDMIILALLLMPSSGVIMVQLIKQALNPVDTAIKFFGAQCIIIIINVAAISGYFIAKNHFNKKKAKKTKRQGFFFIPVYKDFLTDLYSARATLHDRATLPNHTDTEKNPTLTINFNTKRGDVVKEEGIDKYQPRQYFQIVTTRKVLGSQLLVLVTYLQFLTIIGLVLLYNNVQEDDKIVICVLIMLLFRVIMYVFAKLLDIFNKKLKLHIIIFAYYINTSFSAMFCRAVLFHATAEKYIGVIVGCKLFYKIMLYGMFGLRIDFWKTNPLGKIKAKLFRKKINRSEILSKKLGSSSMRTDTLSMKQFEEIEKAKEAEKEGSYKIMRIFVVRFCFGGINDIFYSFASLAFILGYKKLHDQNSIIKIFETNSTDIFIKGTWIEMIVDIGLMLLIGLMWFISKRYKFLRLSKSLTKFFRKYAVIFIYISFALLVTFIFLMQSLEIKNWLTLNLAGLPKPPTLPTPP